MNGTIRIIFTNDADLGIPYAVQEKINFALKRALIDTIAENYDPFLGKVEILETHTGAGEKLI